MWHLCNLWHSMSGGRKYITACKMCSHNKQQLYHSPKKCRKSLKTVNKHEMKFDKSSFKVLFDYSWHDWVSLTRMAFRPVNVSIDSKSAIKKYNYITNFWFNGCSPSFRSTEYNSLNSLVSEAFIRFFLETIGHYSLFITQNERGERVFQREAFRKSVASKSIRRFLGVFMESQMFAGFIQDRELRKTRIKGRVLFAECQWFGWISCRP